MKTEKLLFSLSNLVFSPYLFYNVVTKYKYEHINIISYFNTHFYVKFIFSELNININMRLIIVFVLSQ